jgi:hypothetical protein
MKQVYQVRNAQGQVIGARQSARPYTHALIDTFTNEVVSYSSSEQGAQRAASKFYQYRDEAFRSQHVTAVVPVECIGAVKPVTLSLEGYTATVRSFHAYKYAVVDTATGKVYNADQSGGGMFYTLDGAQAFQARYDGKTVSRYVNADGSKRTSWVLKGDEVKMSHTYNLEVVEVIDPRTAVEPAPEPAPEQAPAVEPAPEQAPAVEPAPEPAPAVEPAPAPVDDRREYHILDKGALISSHKCRLEAYATLEEMSSTTAEVDYSPCYKGQLTGVFGGVRCDYYACKCPACKAPVEPAPAPASIKDIQSQVEPAPAPVEPHQEESTMITLKRLSPAQLAVFSRAPHVTVNGKQVTFEESNAPALITALEEMTGDQRTRMKCARRVKLATGQEVTVKKRPRPPVIHNAVKVRVSEAQRGVLTFINKHVLAGVIAGDTRAYMYIQGTQVSALVTLLEDMHAMKVNTRACSSLIGTLEAHRAEQFAAAPLITTPAPAQDDEQFTAQDDEAWEEDEQFTIQFEATSARVHDPLHDLREVELPVNADAWGDAYNRVKHVLNDYGYTPAGDRVTVARKHISGLLKQLQVISVHGHQGRYINYDLEAALDAELEAWGAAVE